MEEYKCGRIPPCYGKQVFPIHEIIKNIMDWQDTHDKVYDLNKQMCDIDQHLSEAGYFRMISEGQIETRKKLIDMEEKKTKKMTKADAFEYLKGKKVSVSGAEMNDRVQSKLFACGVQWKNGGANVCYYSDYLVITPHGLLCHCDGMGEDYWNRLFHEEISADDILSIEIVEGTKPDCERNEHVKALQEFIVKSGCIDCIIISKNDIGILKK